MRIQRSRAAYNFGCVYQLLGTHSWLVFILDFKAGSYLDWSDGKKDNYSLAVKSEQVCVCVWCLSDACSGVCVRSGRRLLWTLGKQLSGTGEHVTRAFLSVCCSLSLPHVPFSHVAHAKTPQELVLISPFFKTKQKQGQKTSTRVEYECNTHDVD